MKIKDTLVSWYIRNILMPKTEDIYNPGFIITSAGSSQKQIFLREVALPESFLVDLESQVVSKYGNVGKQALYSAGKKFGYSYASLADFKTIEKSNEKEFLDFLYYLVMYVAGSYCSSVNYKIDVKSKQFELELDNYVVCPKNGLGFVMADGSVAGVIAHMLCDLSIEGTQVKCRGRGNEKCRILCAPAGVLSNKNLTFFKETNLTKLEFDSAYMDFNKVSKPHYAKSSLKNLIDTHFFTYSNNLLSFQDERYFFCDFDIVPTLEKELQRLKGGGSILFQCAFDHGKVIVKKSGSKMPEKFIMDYMSSLGWGDILVGKESSGKYFTIALSFPWSKSIEETDYIVFRGIISGILSEVTGTEVILNTSSSSISGGKLNVRLNQG